MGQVISMNAFNFHGNHMRQEWVILSEAAAEGSDYLGSEARQEVSGGAGWTCFYLALLTLDHHGKMPSTAVNHATGAEGKGRRGNFICVPVGVGARASVIGRSPRFESSATEWWSSKPREKKTSLRETRGKVRPESSVCPRVGGRWWRRGCLGNKQRPGEGNIGDTKCRENLKKSSSALRGQMWWRMKKQWQLLICVIWIQASVMGESDPDPEELRARGQRGRRGGRDRVRVLPVWWRV